MDASEIVCANVGPKIFEGVLTASKMHDYLKKWAPQMKQSMFFLNHVTELKFFVIESQYGKNHLRLEHQYQVSMDDMAATCRKELHQKLLDFNKAQGAHPFVTKYQLFFTDNEGEKEVKEQWLIQQGVGNIYSDDQHWNFIDQLKPRHGIAVPLNPATDPYVFRGRVFCFLPLPMECNLPVHINGHFILQSSRQSLCKADDDNDSKQQWNTALLKAIASSYAELLMTIKEDYKILNGEVDSRDVKKYYKVFPSWTAPQVKTFSSGSDGDSEKSKTTAATAANITPKQSQTSSAFKIQERPAPQTTLGPVTLRRASSRETPIPVPTNEWRTLAEDVFRVLAHFNAPIIAVVHETYKRDQKKVETIEWCPLKHQHPASQVHFISKIHSKQKSVLEKIGMKLTTTQFWVREHFEQVGCLIPSVSPKVSYNYYSDFHEKVLPVDQSFPCPIQYTSFKSIKVFKTFLTFILKAIPSKPQTKTVETCSEIVLSQKDTTASAEPIHYPPLIVTADGVLRYCNQENDRVVKSAFTALFQRCLHYFLHPELLDIEVPKNFLLSPSEESEPVCLKVVDQCLKSILPVDLVDVPHISYSKPIALGQLWKCLSEDTFFNRYLSNVVKKWAIFLSKNGMLYSNFLDNKAVLPIIPFTVYQQDSNVDDVNFEELCRIVSTVCQHLHLPFLDTETVPPTAVKKICPSLLEPAFMLQMLYNFHCQSDISKLMTGNIANTLLVYFSHIHLKKNAESLNYLKHLPLFQTHCGKFTSLSGKTVYQWPSGMCTDGQDLWLSHEDDIVFLDRLGVWSKLGLNNEFQVRNIYPIEIYCQFVFKKFGCMNETLRYKHLQFIRDNLFEDAKTHSKMKRSDKRYFALNFIEALKDLPCIGTYPLRAICEFYDHKNSIFSTFKENFLFLPDFFQEEYWSWKTFFEELDFHSKIKPAKYLELCWEMAGKQHLHNTRKKSRVLFQHLFEIDTQEWFSKNFISRVVEIPFVLANNCQGYTWIAKTPPEKHASGTCEIHTDEQPVYLTKLNGACIYDDVKLVWSVKPVYHVPQYGMNPKDVLTQLRVNYRATVPDVVRHLITISETGRADPRLFDTYTAPLPSLHDIGLIDIFCKCFEFLKKYGGGEEVNILKVTACIPVPASDGDREKIVLVKPSQALTTNSAKAYFPYLHQVPYELMASIQLLERIGVKDSIQLSHIQLVLSTIHAQLKGEVIDPNSRGIICLVMSHLSTLLTLPCNKSGEGLSPLYLPGRDNCLHHTSKLVYPDSYSYKDCRLPPSTNYVLLHHPDSQLDQFTFANKFCSTLPEAVRPIPLSELCHQQILQECTSECEDIDMARCLKVALRLEQLPNVCMSTFKKYAKHSIRLDNIKGELSSFFQRVKVTTVKDLQVKLAMKNSTSVIGTAKVEFYFTTTGTNNFCLFLDSKITRMVEEHIHRTMVHELLGAINKIVGKSQPGIVIPEVQDAFCLFLKSQTDEELHDACKICGIELEDLDFMRQLVPQVGRPIPKEWHHMLDQNPDNIFHSQEIVGYEKSEGDFIFAQVLYAIPPEEIDLSQDSTNPLLNRYKIALLDEEITVTALEIFKFVRERRESLAIANTDEQEQESVKEGGRFSNARAAKRHLCQLLKQIWRMSEPERSRAIRRLYLQWHPDKNLDNVELANEVFTFLKRQIERLEQGLDPEEVDEDEVDAVSPSPQWSERYRAWNETASTHTTYRSRHTQYTRSNPSWGGVGVGTTGSDWQAPKPNLSLAKCWVKQAEHDVTAMVVLFEKASTAHSKLCSHVCFMAHEVAEKALKGGMYATCGLNDGFLANHQISLLANALRGERMDCAAELPSLTQPLVRFYLDTRFPNRCYGSVPSDLFTTADAQQACENAMKIFTIVRNIVPTC